MSIVSAPVATMETLPKDFGFVLLTVVGTAALTFWQGVMVWLESQPNMNGPFD